MMMREKGSVGVSERGVVKKRGRDGEKVGEEEKESEGARDRGSGRGREYLLITYY